MFEDKIAMGDNIYIPFWNSKIQEAITHFELGETSYNALQKKIDHLPQAILSKAFRGGLVK